MSGPLITFFLLALLSGAGALWVVLARNVVHAALALLVALLGVSGLFLLAFSEFLALTQVLIYGGAVTVVVLFAIMLTRDNGPQFGLDNPQKPLAAVAALVVFVVLTATFVTSDLATAERSDVAGAYLSAEAPVKTSFEALGSTLFVKWAIPFELAALVLLVALVGSITIARGAERGESE